MSIDLPNKSFWNLQSNFIYDISKPTITSVSNLQVDPGDINGDATGAFDPLTPNETVGDGEGKQLRYRMYFNEIVIGSGTTITYNNDQTSTVDAFDDGDLTSDAGQYYLDIDYPVDGVDHDTKPNSLSIEDDGISSVGEWKDQAGNEIVEVSNSYYEIDGNGNLPNITIDCAAPQIESITSTSNTGDYSLGETIDIKVVFDGEIELSADYEMHVYSLLKKIANNIKILL